MTTTDPILAEQQRYYRARAAEYDQWWLRQGRYDQGAERNAQWHAEGTEVRAALRAFVPRGRILELAPGTGIWSVQLLPWATHLTLVDGAREMLDLAAARLQSERVTYCQADLFTWQSQERYDTIFFSFWLSHVPPDRHDAFWAHVRSLLAPGGRVFFVDSLPTPSSTSTDQPLTRPAGATVLTRRLNDGRTFHIYKIFRTARDIEARLRPLGWSVTAAQTAHYFVYGHGAVA